MHREDEYTLTPEENKRVQDILNIRTKLLNEKIAQQEEHINSLVSQLNDKEEEISALKTFLTEAQNHATSLESQLLALKSQSAPETQIITVPAPAEPQPPAPPKPSYLVSLLRQHFGLDSFKPGQEEAVDAHAKTLRNEYLLPTPCPPNARPYDRNHAI